MSAAFIKRGFSRVEWGLARMFSRVFKHRSIENNAENVFPLVALFEEIEDL